MRSAYTLRIKWSEESRGTICLYRSHDEAIIERLISHQEGISMKATRFSVGVMMFSVLVIGCSKTADKTVSLGGPTGATSWYATSVPDRVPGIDEGTLSYLGTLLAVWSDTSGGIGWAGSTGGVGFYSNLSRPDGTVVEFRGHTNDGKTGTVSFDKDTYDLTKGNLFLVSMRGPTMRVKQLQRDLTGLKHTHTELQAYAKADAEISDFFKATEKK
jgi:hypothetical protein